MTLYINLNCYRNIAFVAGSLLAVLFTLTVIQEDLLTAHNILTAITGLGKNAIFIIKSVLFWHTGIIVTLCRIFIPNEVSSYSIVAGLISF